MRRVLVIGGSVGGLMAGSLLHKAGWEVTVSERAVGDLTGRGAGLGVSAELVDVMARAGVRFEPSAGVVQHALVWMDASGEILFEHRRSRMASAWARVYQPLRDALPAGVYRQGKTLERVEQDSQSVTALFVDGSREEGDLLVAADGALSTVRKQYLPEVQPRFANYVAWRGLVEERDMPHATLEAVSGRIVFCFPESGMLLCMRVPGERLYFIWYRTIACEALAVSCSTRVILAPISKAARPSATRSASSATTARRRSCTTSQPFGVRPRSLSDPALPTFCRTHADGRIRPRIAVGTPIAGRPPHGSVRAEFPHTALIASR